ncbi:TraY domain-containing protein [Bradyrhizobium diazoefficiens]|nr:TraY domain-containing protein [Bradyrhizobium diazoefficiens]QQN62126.1 TraY domain-containing protein [Bradyrhizobium diazoefficiens]
MTNKPRKRRSPGGGRKPAGPIRGNASWLQARITEDLRARLDEAASASGRSLSQEAQLRLQQSFNLPAEMQKRWGTPEVKALAQLVSRLARSVQATVGANPFTEAGDLAWHRNAFTHAAVEAGISTLLAHYKPAGIPAPPPEVQKLAARAPDQAEPENLGRSCAMGLLSQIAIMGAPPKQPSANVAYGDGHYVFPDIRSILGDTDEE